MKGRSVRPTTDRVREAWMSALGDRIVGVDVLDLFAGSGALGFEVLSRGAGSVVAVEKTRAAAQAIRSNAELLEAGDRHTLVQDDVFRFLDRERPDAGVALADPPYQTDDARRLIEIFVARPFARELWLEHPFRDAPPLPDGARTRRYGDTAITTIVADE